jgi:hypothetical protein
LRQNFPSRHELRRSPKIRAQFSIFRHLAKSRISGRIPLKQIWTDTTLETLSLAPRKQHIAYGFTFKRSDQRLTHCGLRTSPIAWCAPPFDWGPDSISSYPIDRGGNERGAVKQVLSEFVVRVAMRRWRCHGDAGWSPPALSFAIDDVRNRPARQLGGIAHVDAARVYKGHRTTVTNAHRVGTAPIARPLGPATSTACCGRAINVRLGAEPLQSIFECSTRLARRRASCFDECLAFCV